MEKLDIVQIIQRPNRDPQRELEIETAEKVNEIVDWINAQTKEV